MSIHWLHLSDIHFHGKDAWRDGRARSELLVYLKSMFDNGEIARPDLVFCTGDLDLNLFFAIMSAKIGLPPIT